MKLHILLPLILCFSFSGLFAQSALLVKDTAGIEHKIQYGKTNVTLVFNDFSRKPISGKLVNYENGNFYLNNGAVINNSLVYQLTLLGTKDKTLRPLANYYFFSINTSLAVIFMASGNGLGTIIIDALVIVSTPITMVVIPMIVAKKAKKSNPNIIPMKGNFR